MEYIQSLITRCGYTDVTENFSGRFLCVQDLDGNVIFYNDYASARDDLIMKYVIQQNS
jgi:hypothetical protein